MEIIFEKATIKDLSAVIKFVDYWLSGRGLAKGEKSAGNDYFVTAVQHMDYLKNYQVLLAKNDDIVVGWAVKNRHGVLIHLLIHADYRHQGIGRKMVQKLNPLHIRSKMNQSTGNPEVFYTKLGYTKIPGLVLGKRKNIEIFTKSSGDSAKH
jgi:GNAT superfamily N-acetyltransferase